MASKLDGQELTSGMAMGVDFLAKFRDALIRRGGNAMLIHRLTLDSGKDILDQIAAVVVGAHFPLLKSEMKKLAARASREEEKGNSHSRNDSEFYWDILDLERVYGVEVLRFADKEHQGDNTLPIPSEIMKQLIRKPLVFPQLVKYEGGEYVVVALTGATQDDDKNCYPKVGDLFEDIYIIDIAPTKYFDLNN